MRSYHPSGKHLPSLAERAGGWLFSLLKNWTLPSAIVIGSVLYLTFAYVPALDAAGDALSPILETLLPVSLFFTLFVTFSKVDFHLMRLYRWHLYVLTMQLLLIGALVLLILYCPSSPVHFSFFTLSYSFPYGKLLLEAVLMCVIAPCASAAPVVTSKLGGSLTQMTTFVLLSSFTVSLLIPAIFPLLEPHQGMTFLSTFLLILQRLASVLLLPLVLGAVVRHWVKPLYEWFLRTPNLSFYSWAVSLSIVVGITLRNILHSHAAGHLIGDIALFTLLTAIVQFAIGRLIGRVTGDPICTGQGMFQKNTGLAIWIAFMYLTPEASIGAGCYVLWQNIINSYELWQHRRTGAPGPDTAATPTAFQRSTRL